MSEKFIPAESNVITTPDAAMADATPVLGEPGEVDLTGMPRLRSLKKLLPSKRNRLYARVLQIADTLPEGFFEQAEALDASGKDAAQLMSDVAGLQESVEEVILSLAVDPEALEEWIIEQDDPDMVEMAIFEKVMGELGE